MKISEGGRGGEVFLLKEWKEAAPGRDGVASLKRWLS